MLHHWSDEAEAAYPCEGRLHAPTPASLVKTENAPREVLAVHPESGLIEEARVIVGPCVLFILVVVDQPVQTLPGRQYDRRRTRIELEF
jgi:hypothetical protein